MARHGNAKGATVPLNELLKWWSSGGRVGKTPSAEENTPAMVVGASQRPPWRTHFTG